MSAKLKYAFHEPTSKYIYIEDAENGLKCNCRCEKCKERLEAIQGNERDWHFRHHIKTDCSGAPETLIHKYAKQIIAEHSEIKAVGHILKYSHPRIEKRLENKITPDVTVCVNGSNIYFEIKVSHASTLNKKAFYRNREYKSIEIDLSRVPYDIPEEELENLVLNEAPRKYIYWPQPLHKQPKNEGSFLWNLMLPVIAFASFVFLLTKTRKYKKARVSKIWKR